jgi:hypothetical protein
MAVFAAPPQFSEVVIINLREAFSALGRGDFAHHLDRMSLCPTLPLISANETPMSAKNIAGNGLPLMALFTTPPQFCFVVVITIGKQ